MPVTDLSILLGFSHATNFHTKKEQHIFQRIHLYSGNGSSASENLQKCVERYSDNRYVKPYSCFDQFLCMTFGQLTNRESLSDIEIFL